MAAPPPDPQALPFIKVSTQDGRRTYELCEEACAILKTFSQPFRVVAVAGAHRTGKSYLMGRLVGDAADHSAPFAVGDTVQAQTKGIWVLGGLVSGHGDAMPVLFMDTEGLFASEATAEQDAEVFALAVLLCDTLLYNSVGAISADSISTLALACKLAHRVASQNETHTSVPAAACLQWVLRDFSLELVDEEGEAMTPLQYMQGALQRTRASSKDAARANASRAVIASVFPERRCCVLPRPCEQPAGLASGAQAPRAEFEENLQALRTSLLRAPGRACASVTGAALLELARAFVDSVNAGAVPSLGSAWRSATAAASTSAMHDALSEARAVGAVAGDGAWGVLRRHALASAAAHSKLTQGTAGFEWGRGGGRTRDRTAAAWIVSRPMACGAPGGGALQLHAPDAEQVLWALHDGALPTAAAAAAGGEEEGDRVTPSADSASTALHSAMWERQLQTWGLPLQQGVSACTAPLHAAEGVQAGLLVQTTNAVYDAHMQRQRRLAGLLSDQGKAGMDTLLSAGCAPADGPMLSACAAKAAHAQLQQAQEADARSVAKEQMHWDAEVAAAARADGAARRQLDELREEEQRVQAAHAGAQRELGDVQVAILQAQQRVSALQAERRDATAKADEAEHATKLQEQELQLAIQATCLRAQRAQEDAQRRQADAQRVAAAEAAAARTAAAAARAKAAAEAAEAKAAAVAAAEAQDREAAASLQRSTPPEPIDESSGKGGGCCTVQ